MFIPPRGKRGADPACTRAPRMLSALTVGAVALGATLGLVPSASADPVAGRGQPLIVDIVGDSYLAGEEDPRHRSLVSPALQALSRVAAENPGLRVDANIVASTGAETADFFDAQREVDAQGEDVVVNPAQHHQVRPNAQVVIVGFGGSDAELAEVLAIAKPSNSSTPGDLDAKIKNYSGLLDISGTDRAYLDQAAKAPLGKAPTLVSRMVQVLAAITNRAPNARIVVTNYPLSVDPENPRSVALIKKRDLVTVQKFLLDVNETIERAVQICACATLVDLTNAHDGHEAYTDESAYAEPAAGQPHTHALRPNEEGAALMADPLAKDLASVLGIRLPKPSGGKVTRPDNIDARLGESDVDGDLVPDHRDEDPADRHNHRQKHDRPDRPDRSDRGRSPGHHEARAIPRLLPDVAGVLEIGRRERDSRPDGNLPVRILPPVPPAQKREAEPDRLPEDQKAAEPEAAERKPSPAPIWPTEDDDSFERGGWVVERPSEEPGSFGWFVKVRPADRSDSIDEVVVPEQSSWAPEQIDESTTEMVPERFDQPATDTTPEQTDEPATEQDGESATETAPERFGETATETAPEQTDESATEMVPERFDQPATDTTPEQDGETATETAPERFDQSATETAPERVDQSATETAPEQPADELRPEEPAAETVPDEQAEAPATETAPAEVPPAEQASEEQPVEQVDEAPPPQPAPADEATDAQQVCILIYPSPASCGTDWNK